ncbi:MAG: carboxypeptidase regulatory-like domain-containing protein [Polyangiaceae bacterium]|nr:carboxypeptidase regulatory-like domain-containing protein [Polyangiaceae bacterium]
MSLSRPDAKSAQLVNTRTQRALAVGLMAGKPWRCIAAIAWLSACDSGAPVGADKFPTPVASVQAVAPKESTATATAAAALAKAKAATQEQALKVLNPKGTASYSGPTGTVSGVVTMSGDAPPTLDKVLAKIPKGRCEGARSMYGRLFREGEGRTLGDVLVAVTKFKGYIPVKSDTVHLRPADCAYQSRTIGMTFGQVLSVQSAGKDSYIPQLIGVSSPALLVALPRGKAIELLLPRPGSFGLIDNTHSYIYADVVVLRYATFDVTGLDGRFDIGELPPGELTVSAYLPVTGQSVQQTVTVKAGANSEISFSLAFEESKWREHQDTEGRRFRQR